VADPDSAPLAAPSVWRSKPGIEDLDGIVKATGAADGGKLLSTSYSVVAVEGM
jgi:hypothetical protein